MKKKDLIIKITQPKVHEKKNVPAWSKNILKGGSFSFETFCFYFT